MSDIIRDGLIFECLPDHKYGPHSSGGGNSAPLTGHLHELVDALLDSAYLRGKSEERERCAKIAETTGYGYWDPPQNAPYYSAHGVAARIRSGK